MSGALDGIEWRTWPGLTPYADAVAAMEARVEAVRSNGAREAIWLVEHPPIYTAGTSADMADLLEPERFDVIATGRGGRHTYHGPGQRVVYAMLDLDRRGHDVRGYVGALEAWIVAALAHFGVRARAIPGATGVWVGDAKIAAIGVRVRRWVTFHGLALNVSPDLTHYQGIRPCGLDAPVTSLATLGIAATIGDADAALRASAPILLKNLGSKLNRVQPNRDDAVSIPLEALGDYG